MQKGTTSEKTNRYKTMELQHATAMELYDFGRCPLSVPAYVCRTPLHCKSVCVGLQLRPAVKAMPITMSAGWVNTVFVRYNFPKLSPDLVSALAALDVNELTHGGEG
jgi:hypothetical protein